MVAPIAQVAGVLVYLLVTVGSGVLLPRQSRTRLRRVSRPPFAYGLLAGTRTALGRRSHLPGGLQHSMSGLVRSLMLATLG